MVACVFRRRVRADVALEKTIVSSVALTGLGIFLTINPGRRSRCSLALGYFLSALQAFNLCEFVKFASKFFVSTPHPTPLPVRGGEGEEFAYFARFAV